MIVHVCRDSADNPAPDVIDELLTTQSASVERGRNELDEQQYGRQVFSGQMAFEPALTLQPGVLVEVREDESGDDWKGKLIGFGIEVGESSITATLTIHRPLA